MKLNQNDILKLLVGVLFGYVVFNLMNKPAVAGGCSKCEGCQMDN